MFGIVGMAVAQGLLMSLGLVAAHVPGSALLGFVSFVLANQEQLTETELADKLGISRKSLWERRQRLNIPRKRTRQRAPRREEG